MQHKTDDLQCMLFISLGKRDQGNPRDALPVLFAAACHARSCGTIMRKGEGCRDEGLVPWGWVAAGCWVGRAEL